MGQYQDLRNAALLGDDFHYLQNILHVSETAKYH